METAFDVSLLSPVRPYANVKAVLLQAPGAEGQMGLLPGHAPMVSQLKPGILEIKLAEGKEAVQFYISGGYLEFLNNTAKILAEIVEEHSDIDADRVARAEKRASERLESDRNIDVDISRALAALERAKARKKLLKMQGS